MHPHCCYSQGLLKSSHIQDDQVAYHRHLENQLIYVFKFSLSVDEIPKYLEYL